MKLKPLSPFPEQHLRRLEMAQSSRPSPSSALLVLGIFPSPAALHVDHSASPSRFTLSVLQDPHGSGSDGAEPARSFLALPALITLLITSCSSSAHCSSLIPLKTCLHVPGTSSGEQQQKLWGWNFSSWGWEYLGHFSRVFSRAILDI